MTTSLPLTDDKLRACAYAEIADSLKNPDYPMPLAIGGAEFADGIATIERFIDAALASDDPPFVHLHGSRAGPVILPSTLAKRYYEQLPTFALLLQALSTRYLYNEHLQAFIETLEEHKLNGQFISWGSVSDAHRTPLSSIDNRTGAEVFSAVVTDLQRRCRAPSVSEKMRTRKRVAEQNLSACKAYVDALFECYRRLIVLRLDFSYLPELAHSIDLTEAQDDIARFLANRRNNKLFRGVVGYVCKIEYGVAKGIHHHVLLFVDGDKRNPLRQEYLGRQLCDYWRNKIAKDRGDAWNSNFKSNLEKFDQRGQRGIGDIRASDTLARQNLSERILTYLCKHDQFFRPAYGRDFRRLRKGQAPKKCSTRSASSATEVLTSQQAA